MPTCAYSACGTTFPARGGKLYCTRQHKRSAKLQRQRAEANQPTPEPTVEVAPTNRPPARAENPTFGSLSDALSSMRSRDAEAQAAAEQRAREEYVPPPASRDPEAASEMAWLG